MSTTVTIIYPDEPTLVVPNEILAKLQGMNLAPSFGFTSPVTAPSVEILSSPEEGICEWGEGMDEPVESRFIIKITDALRYDAQQGFHRSDIDQTLPIWKELEALIGCPLKQASYKV